MSTLRISNIEAKSVPASATVDEKVKITNSSGDPLVFIDGKTSGITTVGINTTDPNITFDANSNVVVTGVITATKFSGQFEPTSVGIADSIFHTGDTNTAIRFPAADTITAETAGSERLRITSGGSIGIGTDDPQQDVHILRSQLSRVRIESTSTAYNSDVTFQNPDGLLGVVGYNATLDTINIDSRGGTNGVTFTRTGTEKLRIDSTGRLLAGTSSSRNTRLGTNSFNGILQIESDSEAAATIARFNNGTGCSRLVLQKGRGTIASPIVVQSGDDCGQILFSGWDGDTFTNAAQIVAEVDGTPGDDDMPGRLIFGTTTDGAATTTERLRIDSNGKFCFGTYTNGYQNNDSLANFVNAASGGTENPLITLWNPTTVADARAGIDFLTNAQSGTGRDGAFIRGSNDGVTAKAHIQFGTIKDESYVKTMELASGGDLSISDGNLVVASSHGIDFSATGSGSGTGTSELFNDYEEGTFSATASASGYSGGSAISMSDEKYTKIGRIVHFNMRLSVASNLSDGDLTITNLPFTASQDSVVNFSWQDAASFNGGQGKISGTSCVRHNGTFPTHSSGTANIIFSGTYITS